MTFRADESAHLSLTSEVSMTATLTRPVQLVSPRPSRYCGACGDTEHAKIRIRGHKENGFVCASARSCRRRRTGK